VANETFQAMSPQDVQQLLRHKNVVVNRCEYPNLRFDEAGLRTLAPLDSQVSILDKIPVCYRTQLTNDLYRLHLSILEKG